MNIEFSPNTGRADIISPMAESGETQKPGKKTRKASGQSPKPTFEGTTGNVGRLKEAMGTTNLPSPFPEEERASYLERVLGEVGGSPIEGIKTKDRLSVKEARVITERSRPPEIVFKRQIPLEGGQIFSVVVERRHDGSLTMNDLPPNKYDARMVSEIIKGSGVAEEVDLPEDWENRSKMAKKALLKKEYGIDSVDSLESPMNVGPQQGGLNDETFRNLLIDQWADLGQLNTPEALQRDAEIARRIQSGNPFFVLSADRDLKEITNSIQNDLQSQQELDQIISPASRQQLEAEKAAMDVRFNTALNGLPRISRTASIGDIEKIGASELQAVRSGFHDIDDAVRAVLGVTVGKREIPSQEGLRMWYAFQKIEQISQGHEIFTRTQVSPDPLENIRNVEIVMRLFEQSKTPENFAEARQSLNGLLHAIELSTHPDIPQSRKEELRKRLDAFELVNTFLIKIDQTEGKPDDMLAVARNFTDETWHYFYDRFNADELLDVNGQRYMVSETDQPLEINILSETQNAFAYQYMVDRFRTNQVQLLLKSRLSIDDALNADANDSKYNDERWLIENIVNLPQGVTFGDLRQNVALRSQLQGELNREWQDDSIRKGLVRRWYEEQTFVGADLYDPESGRKRIDVWQDRIMATVLRQRLERAGVDPQRIDDLEADEELMGALKRNGYDLAKYTYADSIDKLEYFDSKGEHTDTIYGEETPYLARVVTSFMDFALSEAQGDERVNKVVRDKLTYQWSDTDIEDRPVSEGWLLPQNMTAFRILMQGEGKLLSPALRADIEAATRREQQLKIQENGVNNVPERDVLGYVVAKKLFEGIDPDAEPTINDEFANIDWAEQSKEMKRFDIADMLEDRHKSSEWFMGEFRRWLNHPTDAEFFDMTQKYYSMRNVRKHPGTADYLEMQWEVGQHWREWFSFDDDITFAAMEAYVEQARELNLVDKDRGDALKHKLLGREPIQSLRQIRQMFTKSFKTTVGEPGWWGGGLADFIKTLAKYLWSSK